MLPFFLISFHLSIPQKQRNKVAALLVLIINLGTINHCWWHQEEKLAKGFAPFVLFVLLMEVPFSNGIHMYSIQCSFSTFFHFLYLCLYLLWLNWMCVYVVEHVGCLLLLPWLICIIVTPTRFNSKGYSESFPSELAQTFNVWWRANLFRLIAFLCNIPHSHSIPSLVLNVTQYESGVPHIHAVKTFVDVPSIHIKIRICIFLDRLILIEQPPMSELRTTWMRD